MGKLADAMHARRRPPGIRAGDEAFETQVMVGTIGFVEGADHCVALNDDDLAELEQSEAPIWGIRFTVLTPGRAELAKSRGASYVSCTLEEIRADVALGSGLDLFVRLMNADMDEATLRALARLEPVAIAAIPQFPLSLGDAVRLHRLGMITGVPLATPCPVDVSSGDLEVLRDAGLGSMLLPRGATADDVAAVKQRLANLPEPRSRRAADG